MTMYLHFPFVTVPIPINPPPPRRPRRPRKPWQTMSTERTLGNDDMSGKEVAWASTVRSDLIPTSSIE